MYATRSGCSIYFEREGVGSPVILIPGLGLTTASWTGIRPLLVEAGFSVVSIDPRGAGRSDRPAERYVGELMAADVQAVLDECEIGRCSVVGLSMGGMIAQEFAIRFPERLDKLVLTSTYARADAWSRRIFELRREIIEKLGLQTGFRLSFLFVFSPHAFRESPEVISRIENSMSEVDREAFLAQLQFCLDHNTEERLRQIEAPTLVICGEFDLLTSAIQNEELAASIPSARLRVIARASHGLVWERPSDYTAEVVSFLLTDHRERSSEPRVGEVI